MSDFNRMQTIKRRMFAMRNGIIADSLRKGGTGYAMIFGLNLPQIQEIADELPKEQGLADELWADKRTRESLLLAPMVYPRDSMTPEVARKWASEVTQQEVADILCHRLLRHLPYAWELAVELTASAGSMERYLAMRLMWNLLGTHRDDIRPYAAAEAERGDNITRRTASALVEEIDYLNQA